MKSKTTLVRVQKDLADMIAVIAWFDRTSAHRIIDPLVRSQVASRFRKLPQGVRDRVNKKIRAEPTAA